MNGTAFLLLVKLTVLLGALWSLDRLLANRNPRWRRWLWRTGTVSMVVLLFLGLLPPLLQLSIPLVPPARLERDMAHQWLQGDRQPAPQSGQPATISSAKTSSVLGQPIASSPLSTTPAKPTAETPLHRGALPLRGARAVLICIWSGGVLYGFVRWIAGALRVRAVLRDAKTAPDWLVETALYLSSNLRVRCGRVLVTSELESPSVVHCLRPTILLPARLLEDRQGQSDLRAAIAHELAHIRGHDLLWDQFIRLVTSVAWPHPLCWKIALVHRRTCERISDLVAADLLGCRDTYRSSLARMALRMATSSPLGLAMVRRPEVMERLSWLARSTSAQLLGLRAAVATMICGAVVCTLGVSSFALTPTRTIDRTLASHVTNNVGTAVGESDDFGAGSDRTVHHPTDRSTSGLSVGGVVVSEEGEPVPGATIRLHVPRNGPLSRFVLRPLDQDTTDALGHWRFDGLQQPVTSLNIRIDHPEFSPSSVAVTEGLDTEYIIQRGRTVRGTVVGPDGLPVSNALVTGEDRWGAGGPQAHTGEDGSYELKGLSRDSELIVVTAAQLAPQFAELPVQGMTATVDFQLAQAHTIRLRLRDEDGHPAANVRCLVNTWRGYPILSWEGKTNDRGELIWDGAPKDVVEFSILGPGFVAIPNFPAAPREAPHEIVLHRPAVVSAKVIDAATQQSIPEFTARYGWRWPGRDRTLWTRQGLSGRHGELEFTCHEIQRELFLRIEAPGYEPWISEAFQGEGRVELEAALRRGVGLRGQVETPDGRPAAAARVILAMAENGRRFRGGYRAEGGAQQTVTGKDGRFELRPLGDAGATALLVVTHDTGYREISLQKYQENRPVTLEAWAQLAVTVVRQGAPLAHASVSFEPDRHPAHRVSSARYDIGGRTDEAGRVVLSHVVPRSGWLGRTIEQPRGLFSTTVYPTQRQRIDLQPGQSLAVTIGGDATRVSGQVTLPSDPPGRHRWSSNAAATLQTAGTHWRDRDHRVHRFLFDDDGSFSIYDVLPGKYRLSIELTEHQLGPGGPRRPIGSVQPVDVDVVRGDRHLNLGQLEGRWTDFIGPGDEAIDFAATSATGRRIRLSDLRGRLVLLDFCARWTPQWRTEMPRLAELQKKYGGDPRFELVGIVLDDDFSSVVGEMKASGWNWTCLDGGSSNAAPIPRRYQVRLVPKRFLIGPDGTILARTKRLDDLPELIETTLYQLAAQLDVE